MIELNLLPDVKQEFVRSQRLKRKIIAIAIITSMISVGLLVVIAFYTYIAQPVRDVLVDNSIKSELKELKKNKNLTRDLTLQNQLGTITKLHEDKGVASRWLDYLKIINPQEPNNISISKATVDTSTSILSIEATVGTFAGLTVFKDTLTNAKISFYETKDAKTVTKVPLFTDVQISNPSLSESENGGKVVSFKATLLYEPNAVAWSIDNPVLSIPNLQTTPSASQVDLFVQQAKKQEKVQ